MKTMEQEAFVTGIGTKGLRQLICVISFFCEGDHRMDFVVRTLINDAFELRLQASCVRNQSKVVAQL